MKSESSGTAYTIDEEIGIRTIRKEKLSYVDISVGSSIVPEVSM